MLKGLSQSHEVTLFSFYDPDTESVDQLDEIPFCSQVQTVPWKPFNVKSTKAILGLFSLTPRSLMDTYSEQMESLIRDAVSTGEYDLVIASQLSMASYYPVFGDVPAIFEEIELGYFVNQVRDRKNRIERFRRSLTWLKLRQYFSQLLKSFAMCTVVSEQEREIITRHLPNHADKVEVLPNCVNTDDYHGLNIAVQQHRMIFSGSFRYRPNYHAMQWFIRDVFPLVLAQVPDAQLIITGDHANLPLPLSKNITLVGYVEDIKSLIASCSVSLAPLWSGGGTRLKILEAMAIGTPVVATSKGAEGLLVQNGKHILIADEPAMFAQHVIKILRDKKLSASLSSNAMDLVKEKYDWKNLMPKFLYMLEKVALG